MIDIEVRMELEKDYRRVEEITREAFSYPSRIERSSIGCPFEHWMVHILRNKDGITELSYVAVKDGDIIGHIIYSNAHIVTEKGNTVHVLTFGPLSVQPKFQRNGVGKALVTATIAKAKELGWGAILLYGRPEYYPQFGFLEAAKYGITDCNGQNYPSFMAMELKEDYLEGIHGKFYESAIYDDERNAKEALEYDIENFR